MDKMTREQGELTLELVKAMTLLEKVEEAYLPFKQDISRLMMTSLAVQHRKAVDTVPCDLGVAYEATTEQLYRAVVGQLGALSGLAMSWRGLLSAGMSFDSLYGTVLGESVDDMAAKALGEDEGDDHDCAHCEDRDGCDTYQAAQRAAAKASVN